MSSRGMRMESEVVVWKLLCKRSENEALLEEFPMPAQSESRTGWIAVLVALIGGLLLVMGFVFRWPWG